MTDPYKNNRKRNDQIEHKGVLAERFRTDGKRSIRLTATERNEIQHHQLIERAVALFLDVNEAHSRREIAQELGISAAKLSDLTKSEEFMAIYSQYYSELGHDPRLQAVQIAVSDMLPMATKALKEMLLDEETPSSTKLQVIKEIFKAAGVSAPESKKSDKAEVVEFLKGAGVNIDMSVVLPPKFEEAMKEVIDVTPRSAKSALASQSGPDNTD